MLRVMLPLAALAAVTALDVRVSVKIVILINIDVATAPVAIAPVIVPGRSQQYPGPES
jgi:hypothetical protein